MSRRLDCLLQSLEMLSLEASLTPKQEITLRCLREFPSRPRAMLLALKEGRGRVLTSSEAVQLMKFRIEEKRQELRRSRESAEANKKIAPLKAVEPKQTRNSKSPKLPPPNVKKLGDLHPHQFEQQFIEFDSMDKFPAPKFIGHGLLHESPASKQLSDHDVFPPLSFSKPSLLFDESSHEFSESSALPDEVSEDNSPQIHFHEPFKYFHLSSGQWLPYPELPPDDDRPADDLLLWDPLADLLSANDQADSSDDTQSDVED